MERIREEELATQVRITLDENMNECAYEPSGMDNLELDDIIRSKLPDAIRVVLENAPAWMVEGQAMMVQPSWITSNADGTGAIQMPEDFLRLVKFKMQGWDTDVTEPVEEGSAIAIRQKNKYVRGTPQKPVCVLALNKQGKIALEYYSIPSGQAASVECAVYVAKPALEEGYYNIPTLLRLSIINYCAGLTLISRGEPERAEVFFTIAKSYFKENPTG